MKNILYQLFFIFFCIFILALSIRGIPGNPNSQELNSEKWIEKGPFELSPERGRFALLYSIIEDRSFHFSAPLAKFTIPDVGYINGNYVSLFVPGVSFIVIPGYLLGKYLGVSQVGTFAVISLFALINTWLIKAISARLGANKLLAAFAAMTFLFATPSFTYAVTLYQHHISTFLILTSIYLLLRGNTNNFYMQSLLWLIFAISIVVDYPNVFLMFPIIIYLLGCSISKNWTDKSFYFNFDSKILFASITILLPFLFFLGFNQLSYNNPFQLSGTVKTVKDIKIQNQLYEKQESINQMGGLISDRDKSILLTNNKPKEKNALYFFNSRDLLNGFYIHLFSPDRGIMTYTPIILLGVIGLVIAVKQNMQLTSLLSAVMGVNLLIYSLWGDPWGGWAFGSRYLIPSYAILSIFLAIFLTAIPKKRFVLWMCLFILFSACVAVNTAGAITSSTLPPKIEVLALEKATKVVQKYTYEKNLDYLDGNVSKSFFFQVVASKYMTAWQYCLFITSLITLLGGFLIIRYKLDERRHNEY